MADAGTVDFIFLGACRDTPNRSSPPLLTMQERFLTPWDFLKIWKQKVLGQVNMGASLP